MSIIETVLRIIERYKSLYQPSRDEEMIVSRLVDVMTTKKAARPNDSKGVGWWDSVLGVVSELTTRFFPL